MGCGPHPFTQNALQLQPLSGQVQIQRARNRQNTLCPGSLLFPCRIPVSIGSWATKRM